ncbi:MAG TPA: twin-arginine translocase subunit TatC [Actinomycetota bacterium]|nr:twin-arginine translocase subunit TatC [Actinomycetota bacterium]
MTLVQHLEELRRRLIICAIAVAVGSIGGFILYRPVLNFLQEPYREAVASLPETITDKLIVTTPTEPFLAFLKIGLFVGLGLALPVILYQLWRFITPGLTSRERKLGIPFVLASLVLFAGGTVFAFAVVPRGLAFLFSFGGDNLVPLLTIDRYLSFLFFLVLAFGLSFELPLVLLFLTGVGVLSSVQLRRWRRYALMGTVVFAAVATPTQDPYTMLLMAVPIYLLYEGAILIARAFKR